MKILTTTFHGTHRTSHHMHHASYGTGDVVSKRQ